MISVLHPAQTVVQTVMCVPSAFWLSRRSRRKDAVDQLFGMRGEGRSRLRVLTHIFMIEENAAQSPGDMQVRGNGVVREQPAKSAIVHLVVQPARGGAGLGRKISSARLEDA